MQHGDRGLNIHEGGSHRTQTRRDNTSEDNYNTQTDTNGTMRSNAVVGHVADTAEWKCGRGSFGVVAHAA